MPKKRYLMDNGTVYKQVALTDRQVFEELNSMVVQFNRANTNIHLLSAKLHSERMDKLELLRELRYLEIMIDQKTHFEGLKKKILTIIDSVEED